MTHATRYAIPTVLRRMPDAIREGANNADDNGKPDVAGHLRGAASQLEGALLEAKGYEVADRMYVLVPEDLQANFTVLGPYLSLSEARDARNALVSGSYYVLPLESPDDGEG